VQVTEAAIVLGLEEAVVAKAGGMRKQGELSKTCAENFLVMEAALLSVRERFPSTNWSFEVRPDNTFTPHSQ
jgi:hypothetical protein